MPDYLNKILNVCFPLFVGWTPLTVALSAQQFIFTRIDVAAAEELLLQYSATYGMTTEEFLSTYNYDRDAYLTVNWDFNLWYECAEFLELI